MRCAGWILALSLACSSPASAQGFSFGNPLQPVVDWFNKLKNMCDQAIGNAFVPSLDQNNKGAVCKAKDNSNPQQNAGQAPFIFPPGPAQGPAACPAPSVSIPQPVPKGPSKRPQQMAPAKPQDCSKSNDGSGKDDTQQGPTSNTPPPPTTGMPPMDTGGPIFIDTVIVDPPLDPDPIGGGPILNCTPQLVNKQVSVGHLTGTVSLVNPCTGVITTVPVTSAPLQAAYSPTGDMLGVTSFNNAVTFMDPNTLTVKSVITTDDSINPSGIAFSADGSTAYVSSFSPGTGALLTIDVAQHKVVQTTELPQYAQSVFLSPDGQRAYVTCPYNDAVYIVDTLTGTVIHGIRIPYPIGMAFNPTGTRAYITSGTLNGILAELDTSTNQFLRSVAVGSGPEDVVVTADGLQILVANSNDGTVSMINALTFQNQVLTFDNAGYIHGLTLLN